ncbi:mycothiol system anti-sigma-R factor [Corynebacterium breve]|uniref:Mycothiol system anti-sigma-R factor n=1 Tax=Corynebacterium breve TaxID=3049799 RepID=A0ABY8VFN9_9CORY|nr:mycothiol system anti-sigma-R factor [Corynebacterium breve]WIM68294.1 mycothiol system anti-sigma-R factor [Corynebacterium breve]
MNCSDIQALLCELLDDDTSEARAAEIHEQVAACPHCVSRLQSEREVRAIVRHCCSQEQAPEALRQRIVQRISIRYTETRYR